MLRRGSAPGSRKYITLKTHFEGEILNKFDLFDGHADTIFRCWVDGDVFNGGSLRKNSGHIDLERAQASMKNYCQFFAIFGTPAFKKGVSYPQIFRQQYEIFANEIAKNGDLISHCCTAEQAKSANGQGKVAAFLAVEGADLLGCDSAGLRDAYEKGVRAVNLTWNHANALSGSCREQPERGLSELGVEFVKEMFRLGMLVDVSHLSDPGFWDVAALSEQAGKPFMAGHSSSRALCGHPRNLTDEQFAAIVKTGGIAGVNFCGDFLSEKPALDDVVAHIEHWLSLGGERSVAIGGDWDGCDLFPGMKDITGLDALYDRLLRMNYSESLVHGIFYDNLMRVVSEVCTM